MTPTQIRLVQSSWLRTLPSRDAAARLFYERLFEIDPSLRHLFQGDMSEQRARLLDILDHAVSGLGSMEHLLPVVQDLGRRHAGYGVRDEHYGLVGAALLWALGRTLGEAFTPEVRHAWVATYGLLATTMREASHAASVSPGDCGPGTAG